MLQRLHHLLLVCNIGDLTWPILFCPGLVHVRLHGSSKEGGWDGQQASRRPREAELGSFAAAVAAFNGMTASPCLLVPCRGCRSTLSSLDNDHTSAADWFPKGALKYQAKAIKSARGSVRRSQAHFLLQRRVPSTRSTTSLNWCRQPFQCNYQTCQIV